jgi:hypothetical protein
MFSVLGRQNLHTSRNPTRELILIVFRGSTRVLVRIDRCNETALLRDGKHYTNLNFSLRGPLERAYPFPLHPVLLEYLQI